MLGSFSEPGNTLRILDATPASSLPGLSFRLEERGGGYYETAIAGIPGHEQSHSERIDVVTGSGIFLADQYGFFFRFLLVAGNCRTGTRVRGTGGIRRGIWARGLNA